MAKKKTYPEKISEILDKTNDGFNLQPYHLDTLNNSSFQKDSVNLLSKRFINLIYKHVITNGDYDNKFEWYNNIPGIKKDNDGEYYYYGENIGEYLFIDRKEELSFLFKLDIYNNHLLSIGLKLNKKSVERMKWYEEVSSLMDNRIHNMIHICDFLVKDNRLVFFYDREKPFIWDIVNMEKIYINNIEKIENRKLHLMRTGWRSIISMYTNKKVDSITDLPWSQVELFLNYAKINYIKIFDENNSFKSRKLLFDEIFVYKKEDQMRSIDILSLRPTDIDYEYSVVTDITHQTIDGKLVIHEIGCILDIDGCSNKYAVPGSVVNVNSNAVKMIIEKLKPENYYGEIIYSIIQPQTKSFFKSKIF